MTKSKSKYFNTAIRMDQAFLALLEQKDIEYITVKEICKLAGVNRSTFYLHYENINDLLSESMWHMNKHFWEHMPLSSEDLVPRIQECSLEELHLVTPKYLTPYLEYIAQNKRLFRAALKYSDSFNLNKTYNRMMEHVFTPILQRFQIPEEDRQYMMSFYISGLMAVISQWLNDDYKDSIKHVCAVMENCVERGSNALRKAM